MAFIDFYKASPRLGRVSYIGQLSFWCAQIVILAFSSKIFEELPFSLLLTFIVFMVIFPLVNIWLLNIRRLNDVDFRGWWSIAFCIPGIGFILYIALAFTPGTEAANRFGNETPNPKTSSWLLLLCTPLAYFLFYVLGYYDLS